jgi:hypothetical protein
LQHIDEKLRKLVQVNLARDFKLKEGQPELVKVIEEVMKSEAYQKGKKNVLQEAMNPN